MSNTQHSQPTSAKSFNRPVPLWVQGLITGAAIATWLMLALAVILLPEGHTFDNVRTLLAVMSACALGAVVFAYLNFEGDSKRSNDWEDVLAPLASGPDAEHSHLTLVRSSGEPA